MSKNHQIDQLFRDGLQDYESPGAMDLWDKLEEKRDDKKTFLWWKWGSGAALILLAGLSIAYFMMTKSPVDSDAPANSTNTNVETENSTASDRQTDKATAKVSDHLNLETAGLNEKTDQKEDVDFSQKANDVSVTTSPQKVSNFNQKNNNTTSRSSKSLKSENRSTTFGDATLSATPATENPNEMAEQSATKPIAAPTTNLNQKEKNNSVGDEKIRLKTVGLNFLPTQSLLLSDDAGLEMDDDTPIRLIKGFGPRGCYSFAGGRIKYDYYIDGFLSPEYVIRRLDAKDPEDENYREVRESTESVLYGMSGGVRLSIVTRGGLALRTGLVYNRILEKLSVENGSAMVETIQTEVTADGDTIIVGRRIESGTSYKTTYNRYRSLDIPVLLGYEIDAKRFVFNINAGVSFNIWAKQKGEILSRAEQPAFITSNNPQRIRAFSQELGMSFYGSFGLNYKMKNGFQLLMEPNFKYQFNPITLDTYPLEQQYFNIGLLVGLRKQF